MRLDLVFYTYATFVRTLNIIRKAIKVSIDDWLPSDSNSRVFTVSTLPVF